MVSVRIGSKVIGGPGYPCFVVAEVGINHNGSLEIAKKMIDASVEAGADAIKFQKRTIEVIYTPKELAKYRESIFGETNGDLKYGLEFDDREYKEINRYCEKKNILWFASCWDEDSVDFIDQFNPPCYKIASPCLTDRALLIHTRAKNKPIILSTGMSTLEQIKQAILILGENDLVLLHCVSTYPTSDEELNLKVILTLQKEFPNIPIGYSGHGHGNTLGVCAVALGACLVERHITLDVSMWGSDQAASLEIWKFKQMISNIRRFEIAFGDGVKQVLPSEVPIMEKLRRKTDF